MKVGAADRGPCFGRHSLAQVGSTPCDLVIGQRLALGLERFDCAGSLHNHEIELDGRTLEAADVVGNARVPPVRDRGDANAEPFVNGIVGEDDGGAREEERERRGSGCSKTTTAGVSASATASSGSSTQRGSSAASSEQSPACKRRNGDDGDQAGGNGAAEPEHRCPYSTATLAAQAPTPRP